MAKQKVSDLPKEEQDALLNEAKEAGLRMGLVQSWTVETLKKNIQKAKEANGNNGEQTGDSNEEHSKDEETSTEAQTENEAPVNEPTDDENSTNDGDGNEEQTGDGEAPEDEGSTEENNEEPEDAPPAETPAPATPKQKTKKVEKEKKTYICHICRSKVIDGKCTGCGFSIGG